MKSIYMLSFIIKTEILKKALNSAFTIRCLFIAVLLTGAIGLDSRGDLVTKTVNHAPVFTSKPVTEATEDRDYTYIITTEDMDTEDSRTIIAPDLPVWLRLMNNGDGTALLTGTPDNEAVGIHKVILYAEDAEGGKDIQSFIVGVENANDPPVFISQPVTESAEGRIYHYSVITADPDVGDTRTLREIRIPQWLRLEDKGDGTANLHGMPKSGDAGEHTVELQTEDAAGIKRIQSFIITVRKPDEMPVFTRGPVLEAVEDTLYTCPLAVRAGCKITAEKLPPWLTFADKGDGTAVLSGTPSNENVGICELKLTVISAEYTEFSHNFAITIANINDAPVLDNSGDMFLSTIPEDIPNGKNIGTMIAAMMISGGKIDPVTDEDGGAKEGIAVISADKTGGVWQYDENRNGIFTDFPKDIAEDNALLLNDDAVIRLVPAPDFTGSSEIAFRAWDRTAGRNGGIGVNTLDNGGTAAFSKHIEKAVIIVRPVLDIPYFDSTQICKIENWKFTQQKRDYR
jgi:hypothetical protein